MKGKHSNKSIKNNKSNTRIRNNKAITYILLIIFISIMIYSGIQIFNWLKENSETKDIIGEIKNTISIDENKENIEKYEIDFQSLKQRNQDTVAWLKVNGTDIEFPVVKTADNDYYLTHSFNKAYNSAGWAFMDYKNKLDGTDKNIVIYAHNRRDGSLFATLKNILTQEWQSNTENYKIPFITEKEKKEYQVFSVYQIENEDYYITTNFGTNDEFQTFIDIIKSRSEKDFGVDVAANDEILTLSTCADDNNYRVVLHAKKIKE